MTSGQLAADAALFRTGLLKELDGDLAGAEEAFRASLQRPELAAVGRHHLIHVFEAQHRWAEAVPLRRDAFEGAPETPLLRFDLGTALLRLGEPAGWMFLEARKELATIAHSVAPR